MNANQNKQADENISLLEDIVKKLEWSRVEHRYDFETGEVSPPFRVCPLCGGVEIIGYNVIEELQGDHRFHKDHFSNCLFLKIDLSKFK